MKLSKRITIDGFICLERLGFKYSSHKFMSSLLVKDLSIFFPIVDGVNEVVNA